MTPDEYTQLLERHCVQSLASLKQIDIGERLDLYARILSFNQVRRSTKGARNYTVSLAVTDPTLAYNTIKANLFKHDQESLPKLANDHIIVFRNVKLNSFCGHLQLYGDENTYFTVFDYKTLQGHRTEDIELPCHDDIVQAIASWTEKELTKYPAKTDESPTNGLIRGRPILQTDEMVQDGNRYVDYVGMIVDVLHEPFVRRTILFLTDYTENPIPFIANSTEDDAKQGIDHRLLLQCTLFDDQSDRCPTLQYGDFVYLRNCEKKNKVCFEIAIRGQKDCKSNVRILSEPTKEPLFQKLLERKGNYKPIIKRKRPKTPELIQVNTSSLRTTVKGLNAWSSIRDILRLDKDVTGKYMTRAFVIDHKPKNFKDWIRGWCSNCQKTSDISSEWCTICRNRQKPVYQFCLLLQDMEGFKMFAYGFEEDAEELLDGIPASEVLKDDTLFKRLKKTVSMAGDKRSAEHFDFGIRSYISQSGERKYRICDTTLILDEE